MSFHAILLISAAHSFGEKMSMSTDPLFVALVKLTQSVHQTLCAFYENPDALDIHHKADESPVTAADLAAHHQIVAGLAQLTPALPVLSEESAAQPDRATWSTFWLVDPLDGTRDFIHRTDEFTVNIALVEAGRAQMVVIGVPVKRQVYGVDAHGVVWKVTGDDWHICAPQSRPLTGAWRVAVSRRAEYQAAGRYECFMTSLTQQQNRTLHTVHAGSAYKFCLMVDGEIDVYPRLHPTSEWDTAAGQCLLEALGGGLYDLQGRPFCYNQRDTLLNGEFVAVRDIAWLPEVLHAAKA
jgi:3'(2'), 5'-bisphosphate nucleotidase